jgi:pilus assembly protein Flp/PilA
MSNLYGQFLYNESGATAIEYGLIAAGIAVFIIGAINSLSVAVSAKLFDVVSAALAP